jgi:ferredoxin-NADP reductase
MGGPLQLIAGGSGVVPLMAMLRHREAMRSAVATRLLYSSRSYDDIIYRDELARMVRTSKAFELTYTLTRSQPASWAGYQRRIDTDMLRDVVWPREQRPLTFICGPTAMVEAAANDLVRLGHDATQIKTERFGATGGT